MLVLMMIALSAVQSQDYETLKQAFLESYTFEDKGDYAGAIDLLKQHYPDNKDMYEINLRLGWLSYLSGNFTESTSYYAKAVELKPLSVEARFGYIYPASSLGNWEQVKNQYEKILEIDPQNTRANYYLGMIYYGREDYQSAYKYFEKVVNLYPFDYDGLLMLAWTNLKLGKTREAKVLFQKCLLNQPDDESALEGLGLIQ